MARTVPYLDTPESADALRHPGYASPGEPGKDTMELESEPTEVYAMPATPGQMRFWTMDSMNPGDPALNMPLMWQCTGFLDMEALHSAFKDCQDRHESLRTTFEMEQGRLLQIIHAHMNLPLPLHDLSALHGEARRREAERLTHEHAALRMDLQAGPLFALSLLKLEPRLHVVLVTMHHIICDGISNGVLMRDMLEFYRARVEDRPVNLPELPIQFADFAVWHQEWTAGPEPARSRQFWRETLGRDFQRLTLPHDPDAAQALPPDRRDRTGDIETLLVPPDLAARAHAFCAREGVTLNVLLFAIFAALMHRVTGQTDLLIGSPCANRTEDTQDLVGMFMNIQALRVRLRSQSTFRDVLEQVRTWTQGAVDHQMLPFEEVALDPFFSENGRGFEIPVFFLYQKSFMLVQQIGGMEIVPLRSESPGAIFDIMFAVVDRQEEGPRLQLEYNPQNYTLRTVQRWLRQFLNLLESSLAKPEATLDSLSLLSRTERTEVLERWNRTARDFGPFTPLHETFLRQSAREPARPALVCAGESWTYGQLASAARAIAASLQQHGIHPGDRIGLTSEPTPATAASTLAVLMAGAVLVPLALLSESDSSQEIRNGILRDSGIRLILSERPAAAPQEVPWLNSSGLLANPDSTLAELPSCGPDDLACLLYQATTPEKKPATPPATPIGVALEHRSLRNLLLHLQSQPGLTQEDVLVSLAPPGSGASLILSLLAWLSGATFVLPTAEQARDPRLLLSLLQKCHSTALHAAPEQFKGLIDAGWTHSLPLKALCSEDLLSPSLADQILDRAGELWQLYGTPETTLWSSVTRLERGQQPLLAASPVANTQFYLLDEHYQPVSMGSTGELWVGGAAVARGYWKRPDLTAERFRPNPWAPGTLTATGDRAHRNVDGTLQLTQRPGSDRHAADQRTETTQPLTQFEPSPAHQEEFLGPRDVIERQLCQIWQSTLGIPRLSIRTSFFSLGAGSLAALRLITKMNRAFAMDLGVASLMQAPTIQDLADQIRNRAGRNTTSCIVPIQPHGRQTPLFLLHGVGGNVVGFYGLAMRLGADQPVYGIQAQALLTGEPALLQLPAMAARYIAEMRRVQPQGPYRLLGYSFGGLLVLEMAHQLRKTGQQVSLLGMLDSRSRALDQHRAAAGVSSRVTRRVDRFRDNLGNLDSANRVRYVAEKATTRLMRLASRAAASAGAGQVPHWMKSVEDIHHVAVERYHPKPFPDAPMVLFRAAEQDLQDAPEDLGWGSLFPRGVEVHQVPGDHERLFLEPSIEDLVKALLGALDRASAAAEERQGRQERLP